MSPWFHGSLGVFLFISLACGGGAPLQISNDLPPQPKKEEPPPTPEVEMEVLILFGSRKKEEAFEWMEAHRTYFESVGPKEGVGLGDPPGFQGTFPQEEASDTIKGLNPGFHLVIGGYCKPGTAKAPLKALKAVFEGAYTRKVQIPVDGGDGGKPSCPDFSQAPLTTSGIRLVDDASQCRVERISLNTGKKINELGRIPGACPINWSVGFSTNRRRALLSAEQVWLLDPLAPSKTALPPIADLEVAYWDKDTVVAWSNTDGDYHVDEEKEEAWYMYEGKKIPVDDYYMAQITGPSLCIRHGLKGGAWTVRDVIGIATSEGTSPPFCLGIAPNEGPIDSIRIQTSSHGMFYDSVSEDQQETMGTLAKKPMETDWSWVEGGPTGGIGMSTEWLEGAMLTGQALAFDGKKWHAFEGLKGRVDEVHSLPSWSVYLCTDKGFGVFHSRTGALKYWKDGNCLAIE